MTSLPGLKQQQLLSIEASTESSHVMMHKLIIGIWREQCLTCFSAQCWCMSIVPPANVANAVTGIPDMQKV